MDIQEVQIISIRPVPVDVTSSNDAYTVYQHFKSEVECLVTVRNNDVAPLRISTELLRIPTMEDAATQIEKILFELS